MIISSIAQLLNTLYSVLYDNIQLELGLIACWLVFYLFRWFYTIDNIDKRTVLVTGCDSGLGRATALRLDRMGLRVLAATFTPDGRQALESKGSERMVVFHLDVTDEQSVQEAKELVDKVCNGHLWALVNNAGLGASFMVDFLSLNTYKAVMDVNYFGTIRMIKALLPALKSARGRIINVSSFLGRYSAFAMSAYSSSKYAVEAFSDSLRQEMAPWGVDVCIIEPGTMKTPMVASLADQMENTWRRAPQELKEQWGAGYMKVAAHSMEVMECLQRRPKHFTGSIIHAVTAWWPQTRYLDGFDAVALGGIIPLLPAKVADWLSAIILPRPNPPGATPPEQARMNALQ